MGRISSSLSGNYLLNLEVIMFGTLVKLGIFCFCLQSCFLMAEQTQVAQNVFNPCKSALQGLSNFSFIAFTPKTDGMIKTELEKYGKVKDLTVIEETKEGIKISNSDSDATLMFRAEKINSVDGKSLPVFQASLSLEVPSTVTKNGKQCNSIIWASCCFFSEQSAKESDKELAMKGFSFLMKEFINSYAGVNSIKPTFLLSK